RAEQVTVEPLRQLGECSVAAGPHFADDAGDVAGDILAALAPLADQAAEGLLEAGVARVEAQHQAAFFWDETARKRSTSSPTRSSVLSAARLTISLALT